MRANVGALGWLWSGVLLLGTISCVDGFTDPSGPIVQRILTSGAQAQIDSAVQGRTTRGVEDEILRVEGRHPGVGGLFVDSAGALVVFLRLPDDSATLRSELIDVLSRGERPTGLTEELQAGKRIRTALGSYSFSELVVGANKVSSVVDRHPSVVSVDADEATNRVTVGVTSQEAVGVVSSYLSARGVDRRILRFEVVGTPRLLSSVRDYFRPTGGGLQIQNANYEACTLGWNVTNYLADSGFVTASHCDPGQDGIGNGGTIYQPTTSYSQLGIIEINPPWDIVDERCNGYARCAKADVMYVKYTDHSAWNLRVAKTASIGTNYAGGSISVTGWWTNIPYVAGEYVGQPLEKIGRTTGWTGGTLTQSCVNWSLPGSHTIICAMRVTGSRVGQGDSGSPVFRRIGSTIYPVGVLWGGEATPPAYWEEVEPGVLVCRMAGCSYLFSNWNYSTITHLQRQFDPSN